MKRILSAILCLAVLLSVGTALAGEAPLELTMYFPVNVGGSAAALIEQMTADFNAENPDIKVAPVYTGNYDDTVTKIQTAIRRICSSAWPPSVLPWLLPRWPCRWML